MQQGVKPKRYQCHRERCVWRLMQHIRLHAEFIHKEFLSVQKKKKGEEKKGWKKVRKAEQLNKWGNIRYADDPIHQGSLEDIKSTEIKWIICYGLANYCWNINLFKEVSARMCVCVCVCASSPSTVGLCRFSAAFHICYRHNYFVLGNILIIHHEIIYWHFATHNNVLNW